MRVTLDASVVMKWFVAESLHEEAQALQTGAIERHAPQLLATECANVVWRKARSGEIAHPESILDEIFRLGEAVALHADRWLLPQAAVTALRIGHPVYDCLYVACAELTDSALVTADRRLARLVSDQVPDLEVIALQDGNAIDRIGSLSGDSDTAR